MTEAAPTHPSRFRADEGEVELRRQESNVALAVAGVLLAPAVVSGGVVGAGWLVGALGPEVALQAMFCAANPLVVLVGVIAGFLGLSVRSGRNVRVVLHEDHLAIPADGTQGVFAPGLRDGYRYVARKGMLVVRVPYGRVVDVRRVTDPDEQRALAPRRVHRYQRVRMSGRILGESVRGLVLTGPGAEEQAPRLLADELRTGWVTDPSQAVALTFDGLRHDNLLYPALPAVLERPTLYVSVADPDALVTELSVRVAGAPPVEALAAVAPRSEVVPVLPVGAATSAEAPSAPPAPAPPVVRPARARPEGPSFIETPLGRRLVQLGTGAVWFTLAAGSVWLVTLAVATAGAFAQAGDMLMRDAHIAALVALLALVSMAYAVHALVVAVLEGLIVLVGGFGTVLRRVVWTGLLCAAGARSLSYAWEALKVESW